MKKNEKVIRTLNNTLGKADDTGLMLKTGLHAYDRLSKYISHLPAKVQADIVHETTMIAYDARISAFNHILNYDTKGNGFDSKDLAGRIELPVQHLQSGIERRGDSDL